MPRSPAIARQRQRTATPRRADGPTAPNRALRTWLAGITAFALVAGCSGSDDNGSGNTTADTTNGSGIDSGAQAGAETGSDDLAANPASTVAPIVLADDVIIDTEDGEIPSTTTDPPIEETPDAPPTPDATSTTAAPVAVPQPAQIGRIVSMSPTHTETLYALGLGEFVVAVDNGSDTPEEALAVRRADLDASAADVSAILAFDPDVVLVGDDPTGLTGRLNEARVASYSGPPASSLDDVYTQIRDIAQLVGRPDLADDLIERMQGDIRMILSVLGEAPSTLPDDGPLTFFHEIDPSLFTIGTGNFLSSVYGELGLVNIVAVPDVVTQISADDVIAADPDVIVLGDAACCGVTIDVLAGRPGWDTLSAVEAGAVVPIDEDLLNRWGPRVVELIRLVAGGIIAAAG